MLHATQHTFVHDRILARNGPCARFFEHEALPLANICRRMAERFSRGGRLLGFGRGPYATDAMHASVEFIHPVIVGKRALPALDISLAPEAWLQTIAGEHDMVIAFGPPAPDHRDLALLRVANACGAMTIAWPGTHGDADYAVTAPDTDAHIHQELFELLGHTMYESVHVFLEHLAQHSAPPEDEETFGFLYPFLDARRESEDAVVDQVAESIRMKAHDACALRSHVAAEQSGVIARAAAAIAERIRDGGRILAFGNGGSATDATDFALDCIMPENGWPAVPALSLSLEPAVLTATANDVGVDVMFLRQVIAQSRPGDVAIAFSTSGGSHNVIAALEEARKHGLLTVALLGYDGGEIVRRNLADIALVVRSDYVPRIQEAQGTIYHVLREALAHA